MKFLRSIWRIYAATPAERKYAEMLRETEFFDADYYRATRPRNSILQQFPHHHYVIWGERQGLKPSKLFCPAAYLKYNPDVADSGSPPLQHFLRFGQNEDRRCLPLPDIPFQVGLDMSLLPPVEKIARIKPRHRIAVVLHLFFYELWPEIRDRLANMPEEFDLFCTVVPRDNLEELTSDILAAYPHAHVIPFPNHGRDLFPLTHLVNSGVLFNYDAICKIHTKKSLHREDGDFWREHLIGSILPDKDRAAALLERFLRDPSLGIVVADGQIFEADKWWGSNRERVRRELLRVGINTDRYGLRFAGGSIYWMKPAVLRLLHAMYYDANSFELEGGQFDGTLAHCVERMLGFFAASSRLEISEVSRVMEEKPQSPAPTQSPTSREKKVYAFYLPQFHPIAENDQWWGKGFTEWRNVTRAQPLFEYHTQPRLPKDLGFYDLRVPEVMQEQALLAREHGIDGFCSYFYWFNGKRLLQTPFDNLISSPSIDFPFFFCWANERWTKTWDGLSEDILIEQTYEKGFGEKLARDLIPYFRDPRYIKSQGAPKFIIYRPADIPGVAREMQAFRETVESAGFPGVELGAGLFHLDFVETEKLADIFDFFVEIPPHGLVTSENYYIGSDQNKPSPIKPFAGFNGLVYDYEDVVENSLAARHIPDRLKDKVRRGVMLGWDNTPRRGKRAHISFGCNPATFGYWLENLLRQQLEAPGREPVELYINAWNEWAEGAYLEPDLQYGHSYLQAVKQALRRAREVRSPDHMEAGQR